MADLAVHSIPNVALPIQFGVAFGGGLARLHIKMGLEIFHIRHTAQSSLCCFNWSVGQTNPALQNKKGQPLGWPSPIVERA
ncbi:MAG: hypothetical protein ACFB11_23980 [Paracoccaceae bacterium]